MHNHHSSGKLHGAEDQVSEEEDHSLRMTLNLLCVVKTLFSACFDFDMHPEHEL